MTEALWPYAAILLLGALPNGVWRAAAALLARHVAADSPLFDWVRAVAAALVAGVVAKLIAEPPPAIAAVPFWGRIGAIALAVAVYLLAGRRMAPAIATGLGVVALAMLAP